MNTNRTAAIITLSAVSLLFAATSTINWDETYQEMDGFGAFTYGIGDDWTDETARDLCDTVSGAGLSIIRFRIPNADDEVKKDLTLFPVREQTFGFPVLTAPHHNMDMAKKYGCNQFLFTSWSPPSWMKDNNSWGNGGSLLPEYYDDYAQYLANYSKFQREAGYDVTFLSPANEPDLTESYESSIWTGEQFRVFIKDHLGPTFEKEGITTKIIMGEMATWHDAVALETMEDSVARNYVYAVAGHAYSWSAEGGDLGKPLQNAYDHNKKIWQTEVCTRGGGCSADIGDGVGFWGRSIHNIIANAQSSTFLYWFISMTQLGGQSDESLRCPSGEWRKLLWVMGNWSRYARPGFHRIGAVGSVERSGSDDENVLVSAFRELSTGKFAIVVLNTGGQTDVTITIDGCTFDKVTPVVTSASLNLAPQGEIAVSGNSFTYTLEGMSATTFIGKGPEKVAVFPTAEAMAQKQSIRTDNRFIYLPVSLADRNVSVSIVSPNGRLVFYSDKPSGKENNNRIAVGNLAPGMYMLKLEVSGVNAVMPVVIR